MTPILPITRLLDADVLIDIQRQHPPVVSWYNNLSAYPAVPGLQVLEVDLLIAPLAIVWPTEADCRRALLDFHTLPLLHGLGLVDALVAATALGLNATLCTFNVKHDRAVAGLVTDQPYTR